VRLRWVREIFLGAALTALAWHFVAAPVRLSSDPLRGWALADRLSYRLRAPRRGERVAFLEPDHPDRLRLGRIAVLPLEQRKDQPAAAVPAGHYAIRLEGSGPAAGRLIGAIPRLYILGPLWGDTMRGLLLRR
jgi:hypothetical protein